MFLQDCGQLIGDYLGTAERKQQEIEALRMLGEKEGRFEVAKIISVEINKIDNKRNFLIRWKGYGTEQDTWEPEENLECAGKIEKFMTDYEKQLSSKRSLREAPKKVVGRLEYDTNKRTAKRNAFR